RCPFNFASNETAAPADLRYLLSLLELGVDGIGERHQLLAAEPAGERVGERAVDPIERAEAVALGKLEGGVVEARLLADVERETATRGILVHELRRGQAQVGEQAPSHQLPAPVDE